MWLKAARLKSCHAIAAGNRRTAAPNEFAQCAHHECASATITDRQSYPWRSRSPASCQGGGSGGGGGRAPMRSRTPPRRRWRRTTTTTHSTNRSNWRRYRAGLPARAAALFAGALRLECARSHKQRKGQPETRGAAAGSQGAHEQAQRPDHQTGHNQEFVDRRAAVAKSGA